MNYIIILNYNNWEDTIECLESVFKLKDIKYKVIVCDNNSTDNSLSYIEEWALGTMKVNCKSQNKKINDLVHPFEKKPIPYLKLSRSKISNIGSAQTEQLILIQTEQNLGYSFGNNVGIKYAIEQEDCKYIWILNNDTVVEPLSLKYLVDTMNENPFIGICGVKTYFYYNPDKIQCKSGFYYNKWLAYPFEAKNIDNVSYVNGASMLVKKEFIQDVGLLCEDYFLYYEEIDWVLRGKNKYQLGYSEKSIIYHKEGGSINKNEKKSLLSDFYAIRNRILITKKFYKYCLPTVYLGIVMAIINRLRRKQYTRAWIFIKIMFSFGNNKYKK